jgi:ribosomal protein S18 acetylase RimI-like enzyme
MNHFFDIRQVQSAMESQLAFFFRILSDAEELDLFHPHPFTSQQASVIANCSGKDFYVLMMLEDSVVGYGMLRGWDEGYDIPSLGITIHPKFRGLGIGNLMMQYLHVVARLKGCQKIRLRVKKGNTRARRLYEKFGYQFTEDSTEYSIGLVQLKSPDRSKAWQMENAE